MKQAVARVRRVVQSRALAACREEIRNILDQHQHVRHILVFAPSLKWNFELFQRPQQLAIALARRGVLVFYMEPELYRSYRISQLKDRLYLCDLPSDAFEAVTGPLVYLLCWNRDYLKGFTSPRLIYDYIDDLSVFRGDPERIARDHGELLSSALLTMATADHLYQDAVSRRPDCLLCPNGVDYEHFARARGQWVSIPPEALAPAVAEGKPIIGYCGALAWWFDYDLLRTVAEQRKDLSFVLIGPNYDNTLVKSGIYQLPNMTWLGIQPYSELPDFLRYFDVAIIPFRVNKITQATSPLKLFEYMASGKPVLITPMHESMRYEGVMVASSATEFSSKLDEALELATDPAYLAVIDRVAGENTWDARAVTILKALDAGQS
jgi:glycosyltransferase involved in cell wall biosynthesis